MAKIISRTKQNDVYQRITRIIAELQKAYDQEASAEVRYAIEDAFDIAYIIGGMEMLEAMGQDRSKMYGRFRIGDKLSAMVELIDDCQWR